MIERRYGYGVLILSFYSIQPVNFTVSSCGNMKERDDRDAIWSIDLVNYSIHPVNTILIL